MGYKPTKTVTVLRGMFVITQMQNRKYKQKPDYICIRRENSDWLVMKEKPLWSTKHKSITRNLLRKPAQECAIGGRRSDLPLLNSSPEAPMLCLFLIFAKFLEQMFAFFCHLSYPRSLFYHEAISKMLLSPNYQLLVLCYISAFDL